MTACTDDERREVARRLRSLRKTNPGVTSLGHSYLWSLLWAVCGEGLGESNRDHWFERMCSRIADLIEPSCDRDTPQKVAEEMFGKMRHSTKEEADAYDAVLKSKSVEIHPVDREALLALVDDMGRVRSRCEHCNKMNDCDWVDETVCLESYIDDYARRIREALGVCCEG